MANYHYVALDPKGNEQEGHLEAETQASAIAMIKEKGLFPTQVEEQASSPARRKRAARATTGERASKSFQMPHLFSRVKTKQMMVVTRQLATLINAGLPLLRCLRVLERQERNPRLKGAFGELAESIQAGSTFGDALAQHPKIFNKLYVNMVKAGELGGVLDVVLVRLAEFMEKAQRIKSKIVSAMAYPVVVLIMACLILTFLMTYVVPKFESIFQDLLEGAELPALTQAVMNVSRTLSSKLPWIILAVAGVVVVIKLSGKMRAGRRLLDYLKLNFPLFGTLIRKTSIARFSRTLGTLLSSGVPILQALTIVKDTAGNEIIGEAVDAIHDSVKEGENIAPPAEATGVFPPVVISMIEVGEETGELPEMLIRIADAYENEVDDTVAGLTSVIEPLLIVFLAIIVGTIVIALFLPLISVIGKLS